MTCYVFQYSSLFQPTICSIRVIWFYISSLTSHERTIIKQCQDRDLNWALSEYYGGTLMWGLLIHLDPAHLRVTCHYITQLFCPQQLKIMNNDDVLKAFLCS